MPTDEDFQKAREILLKVASGELKKRRCGLIGYKEFWEEYISDTVEQPWGQIHSKDIVELIGPITSNEIKAGRPPLNCIVVRSDTKEPGEPIELVRNYHHRITGIQFSYNSWQEAQEACWAYWRDDENRNNETGADRVFFRSPDELGFQHTAHHAHQVLVNRFERDTYARKVCIDHYGCKCMACEFDFEKIYGEIGANYIHVHHIIMVSRAPMNYKFDPIRDLVPLCPNCHSMIHTDIENPISVEGLQKIMKNVARLVRPKAH